MKNTIRKYIAKKKLAKEIDINYLMSLLNRSKDDLSNYLIHSLGFRKLYAGGLLKGSGPILLTAHIDTKNTEIFSFQEDSLYPIPVKMEGNLITKDNFYPGISEAQKMMSLGADDRCGVFLALILQEKYPDIYTIFFTDGEERGHGYNTAELTSPDLWRDRFVICLDSTEKYVFSYHSHLEKFLSELNEKFGFKWEKKSLSNLQYMKDAVGINLGMGYAKQHTPDEYIRIDHLESAYFYVIDLTKKLLKD